MEDVRARFRQAAASRHRGDHGAAASKNKSEGAWGKPSNKLVALLNSIHYCLVIFIPS
jgi:hypothetical protein